MKERLDVLLVKRNLASSREKPLTRGILVFLASGRTARRFIPAHAGNTLDNRWLEDE